jgi:hypothetical protein
MSFLPIEEVKNLTNHISAPWEKNYELALLFCLRGQYKNKNEKRKGKLVFLWILTFASFQWCTPFIRNI